MYFLLCDKHSDIQTKFANSQNNFLHTITVIMSQTLAQHTNRNSCSTKVTTGNDSNNLWTSTIWLGNHNSQS